MVAYRFNLAGLRPPAWTRRTQLAEGWDPLDETPTPPAPEWSLLDMFETPAELLEKGITFSYRNMELA
jgi:hypothetical protein